MGIQESLAKRRTYYNINKELPVAEEEVVALVENTTELVPDAFNMKSARVIVVTKAKQDALWDAIYEAFGGKVAREKIDSFKAGYGTLLYFYDEDVVKGLQEQFPLYAANFPIWAQQANGMLQISIWTATARAQHRRQPPTLQPRHRRDGQEDVLGAGFLEAYRPDAVRWHRR